MKSVPTIVLKIAVLALVMVGFAAAARADDGTDLYVGYQYLHISSGGSGISVPLGISGSVVIPVQPAWSAVGDVGWNHKSEDNAATSATTLGAGLRFVPMADRVSSLHPYFQAVIGVELDKSTYKTTPVTNTDTNFMLQPGVGARLGTGKIKGYAEANYRWVHASGDSANDLVLRAGVIFNIGE